MAATKMIIGRRTFFDRTFQAFIYSAVTFAVPEAELALMWAS